MHPDLVHTLEHRIAVAGIGAGPGIGRQSAGLYPRLYVVDPAIPMDIGGTQFPVRTGKAALVADYWGSRCTRQCLVELCADLRQFRDAQAGAGWRRDWQHIGQFPIDGNRGVGTAYFYIAQGARRVTEVDADDLEEQELLLLTREEVESALDDGEIKLLPWATIVALALRYV